MTVEEIQSNTVEEIFCKPLDKEYADLPLLYDQFEVFMSLLTMSDEDVDEIYTKGSGMLYLIKSRLKHLDYDLDKKTQIMLSFIVETPGDAVMYVYYLAYKAKQKNKDIITFDDFVDIFPMGYFRKKQLDEAWEAQKIDGANLLDYSEASESLNQNKDE